MIAGLDIRIRDRRGDAALDIAVSAPLPGVVTLVGRSGAGKSSVLSAVAGLWRPREAVIRLGDQTLQDAETFVPVERRGLGVVFQDSRLFPHLTVRANLLYGASRVRDPDRRAAIGFEEAVALLGIGRLLERRPATLSGGERQRVAIGRALLARPRLLLMDEPLASLDAERRGEILACLQRLRRVADVPILYVTHSLDEVAALADSVVVVEAGRVAASGPAGDVLGSPALPLARGRDAAALLDGTVAAHDPLRCLTRITCGDTPLLVPLLAAPVGARVRLRIPAREVIVATEAPRATSLHNAVPAVLREIAAIGETEAVVSLALAGGAGGILLARITRDAVDTLSLAPGATVLALVKSTSIETVAGAVVEGISQ